MEGLIKINFSTSDYLSDAQTYLSVEMHHYIRQLLDEEAKILIHTSGSTGKAKQISLDRRDIRSSVQLTADTFGLSQSSQLLHCLPVQYIAGRMMLYRAILLGATLYIVSPSLLPLKSIDHAIDLVAMTPMQVEHTLAQMPQKFKWVRTLLIGGAPVSPRLEQQIKEYKLNAFLSYGMTETLTHVALRDLGRDIYFKALGGISFDLDNDGCLVINTPHLKQKQFKTRDLVYLEDEHHFLWMGRSDHVINSGGIKILPEKIEKQIARLFSHRFYVTGIPDDQLGEKLVLVIEIEAGHQEHYDSLEKDLQRLLTRYEMPKNIIYTPRFIETPSGKVNRIETSKLL